VSSTLLSTVSFPLSSLLCAHGYLSVLSYPRILIIVINQCGMIEDLSSSLKPTLELPNLMLLAPQLVEMELSIHMPWLNINEWISNMITTRPCPHSVNTLSTHLAKDIHEAQVRYPTPTLATQRLTAQGTHSSSSGTGTMQALQIIRGSEALAINESIVYCILRFALFVTMHNFYNLESTCHSGGKIEHPVFKCMRY